MQGVREEPESAPRSVPDARRTAQRHVEDDSLAQERHRSESVAKILVTLMHDIAEIIDTGMVSDDIAEGWGSALIKIIKDLEQVGVKLVQDDPAQPEVPTLN